MAQGRAALRTYLEQTLGRLDASGDMDASVLKQKAMPAIVASIRRMCAGAPPEAQTAIETVLVNNGVAPDYEADVEALKTALRSILGLLAAPAEQRAVQGESQAVSNAAEDGGEAAEPEDEGGDASGPLAGPSGGELEEDQDPGEDEAEEHAEAEEAAEPDETAKAAEVSEPVVQAETQAPAEAGPPQSVGRAALREYVDNTLAKIDGGAPPDENQLREYIMPAVAASIRRLSAGAPTDTKDRMRKALVDAGVLPDYATGLDGLRTALVSIREIITGASPQQTADMSAKAPPLQSKDLKPQVLSPANATVAEALAKPKFTRAETFGHELRGASAGYLATTLMAEVKSHGFTATSTVRDIEPTVILNKGVEVICPRDQRLGAAYVDCIEEGDASMATHMLSYTWGYMIGDIVDSIMGFCTGNAADPTDTFFWICCLCINQHRVREASTRNEHIPFEQFKTEFGNRVRGIGHVVALMAPWQDPQYTKRVWCDFEMFTAASMGENACKVSVTMPPREVADMRKTLVVASNANNTQLWEAFENVKIQDADASVLADKEMILKMIEDDIGFQALNGTVVKCLNSWIASSCEDILSEYNPDVDVPTEEAAKSWAGCGYILRNIHQTQRALEIMEKAVDMFKRAGVFTTHEGAILMSNLGATRRRCQDLPGAFKAFDRAKTVFEKIGSTRTVECATFYLSVGAAHREANDMSAAFNAFDKSRDILEEIDQFKSLEGAMLMNTIGAAKRNINDMPGALAALAEARNILETTGNLYSPAGHVCMNTIAAAKRTQRDWAGVLEAFKTGLEILEKIGMKDTDKGLNLLLQLGRAQRNIGQFVDAAASFELAKQICDKLRLHDTKDGIDLKRDTEEFERKGSWGKGRRDHKGSQDGKSFGKGKWDSEDKGGYGKGSGKKGWDAEDSGERRYSSKGKDFGKGKEYFKGGWYSGKDKGKAKDDGKGKDAGKSNKSGAEPLP